MDKNPLISIIMPVRNASPFLREAIESIRQQTYSHWELLCVDDGSTDNSFSVAKGYEKIDQRITVLRNRGRRGIAYSLNRCIEQARGDFIARMDADDISLPQRFALQVALLSKQKDLIACGGQVAIMRSDGLVFAYKKFPIESSKLYKMIMQMIPLQHPTLMVRAEVFKKYHYRENLPTAEDVDMLFFLLGCGNLSNVDEVVYLYRKSDASNGYHNVKQTFFITFLSRFEAVWKYSYKPTPLGILTSVAQLFVVSLLPGAVVVKLFEAFRYEPPVWKRYATVLQKDFLQTLEPAIQ